MMGVIMQQPFFTKLATNCLQASERDNSSSAGISTLHLLEQILAQPECNAHKALVAHGLKTGALLYTLSRYSQRNPTVEPAMRSTMEKAIDLTSEIPSDRVGTDHLLLALFANESSRGGFILKQLGLSGEGVVESVRRMSREV